MSDLYQVTGECAFLTVRGAPRTLLLKGAVFNAADVPEAELKHNEESELVEKVDGEPAGINSEGGLGPAETPATGPDSVVSVTPLTAEQQRRRSAAAKLPADGSAPDGRAGQDVWVEYAVSKGMDRTEAEKASPKDLREALKG